MQVFVTGGSGLLGSNLVRQLAGAGNGVKALARSEAKARSMLGDITGINIIIGDMENIPGFAHEMAGCDVLFHTAAYFRESFGPGNHWPMLDKINVRGTVALFEEAERHGVQRAIHISSIGVLPATSHGHIIDEDSGYGAGDTLYRLSKIKAEKAIAEFMKSRHLEVVTILPGWMFGPGDSAPTDAGKIVLNQLSRGVPGIIDGGNYVVDARDVAAAMMSAVDSGKSGERYIVAGRKTTMKELLQTLEHVGGVPLPRRTFSFRTGLALATMTEALARLTRRPSLTTASGVRMLMGLNREISSQRAVDTLGASFRPLEETLRDEVRWYRENGYLVGK